MTQNISFDVDRPLTKYEVEKVLVLAALFVPLDLRVNEDPTNIKVYLGKYYNEPYRIWVDKEGVIGIVERDISTPEDDEAEWVPSYMHEAVAYFELVNKVS